jgi:hypothetical protein
MIEIFAFTADGIRYTTDIKTSNIEATRRAIKADLKVKTLLFEYREKKDPQTIDRTRSI